MDLGKIMIGTALVMLAAGMLVSPSTAAGCDGSCTVGCGNAASPSHDTVNPYSPDQHGIPADYLATVCGPASHRSAP